MRRNWLGTALCSLVVILAGNFAAASGGSADTGGGKVVVCRKPDKKIKSVELLDLWEAKEIQGWVVQPSDLQLADLVFQKLDALKFTVDWELRHTDTYPDAHYSQSEWGFDATFLANNFLNNQYTGATQRGDVDIRWLPGVQLTVTADSYEVAVPTGCAIEQAVLFQDGNPAHVIISKDLTDRMDKVNYAALIVHEVYYAFLRKGMMAGQAEPDSRRVRRIVGLAFSIDASDPPDIIDDVFKPVLRDTPVQLLQCTERDQTGNLVPQNTVYIFKHSDQLDLPFSLLGGLATRFNGRQVIGSGAAATFAWDVGLETLFADPLNITITTELKAACDSQWAKGTFDTAVGAMPSLVDSDLLDVRVRAYVDTDGSHKIKLVDMISKAESPPLVCRLITRATLP